MACNQNIIINTDICDARKIEEEHYRDAKHIMINADVLIVNDRAKDILADLPVTLNCDETLNVPDGVELHRISVSGEHEIRGSDRVTEGTFLVCNGSLTIHPGAEEVLKQYIRIVVNGSVTCPESLSPRLTQMTVNGSEYIYPDDCTVLKKTFVIDPYFPMRVREHARYYAGKCVIAQGKDTGYALMREKGVSFVTKHFIVHETNVNDCIPLIDETVELKVIPDDTAIITKDAVLDDALMQEIKGRAYIRGDLVIDAAHGSLFDQIQYLDVDGTLTAPRGLASLMKQKDIRYKKLTLTLGRTISNSVRVTVDRGLLDASPDGISVTNCAAVQVAPDITGEEITEKLAFANCAVIRCSQAQRGAISAVAKNCAMIRSGEEEDVNSKVQYGDGEEDADDLPFGLTNILSGVGEFVSDALKSAGLGGRAADGAKSRVINADEYMM